MMRSTYWHTYLFVFILLLPTWMHAQEFVKMSQEFTDTFNQAYSMVPADARSAEMRFLKEHLDLGGDFIYADIATKSINECLDSINPADDNTKKIIADLHAFKNQINGREVYDMGSGTVYKRTITRSHCSIIPATYKKSHCYRAITDKSELKNIKRSRQLRENEIFECTKRVFCCSPCESSIYTQPCRKGATGRAGATGPTGLTGASGATGNNGAQGAQGVTGATGSTGDDGIAGEIGANGAIGSIVR